MVRLYLLSLFGLVLMSSCSSQDSRSVDKENSSENLSIEVSTCDYGIDVSHHNGEIDWEKVSSTQLLFVYIKATEGATHVDKRYAENFEGAKQAGYKVGSYHFFRMTSSAHDQFANFKKTVSRDKQDLIPMVDVETSDKHSAKELRDSLNVFIGLVREYYGVRPMIYATNKSYNQLCGGLYPSYYLYIGRYGEKAPQLKGKGQYTIWQFTESARIDGIPKPVDKAKFNPRCSISDILYKSENAL